MYNLGDNFKIDQSLGFMDPNSIFQGNKYRITILTERLIRLEYNVDGVFKDTPTELIWNRMFETPKFETKEDQNFLEVTTSYFKLSYIKEKSFKGNKVSPGKNLKVYLNGTDKFWYYEHPEVRNYKAPGISLDSDLSKNKSLFSIDGFASIDDSNSHILNEAGLLEDYNIKNIDIYLFMYKDDFKDTLIDYFHLTGYPSLVPRYALGNWWHKDEAYTDQTLKKLIDEFEYEKVPLSVLLLDSDWHIRNYQEKIVKGGFTWDTTKFTNPTGMINYLHSKGIRLGLSINPEEGIYPFESKFEDIKKYLTPDESGMIPFNALDPRWIDVYLKLLIHPLDNMGVDFFFNDIENVKDPKKLWLFNHYQFNDMKRDYKRRPMVVSRNGMVAAHRYPVLYAGKTIVGWDSLKKIPVYNSSASNIGVSFWSHNIGGYHKGVEDPELYIRYVQLGTFSPILKLGADKGKYYKRAPWLWDIKTYTVAADYLQLRHKLIPYLYTEAYNYHKEGVPFVQPVYYKYPVLYDDVLYKNEYYFGSQLFVAPIINKKDIVMNRVVHKFYMPDGIWYDFVTGKKFPGNKDYVSFFKDEDYPVFARAGAIIPLGINDNMNDTTPPKNMEIHVFPGKNNTYKLYEDDGVSDLYRKDFYLLTSIDYNYLPSNYTVIIRALEGKKGIVPDFRNYKIIFRNTKQANDVIVYFNNEPITYKKYVDGPNFIVEVENVATVGQLTINCKGKDIEIDAVRLINDDIENIISDLPFETTQKEKIDAVLFSDLPINKKRIAVRKLGNKGLPKKFVKVFLKLLEYVGTV